MTKAILFFLFSLMSCILSAQIDAYARDQTNSCVGAINIFENGDFRLQFEGVANTENEILNAYPSLVDLQQANMLWCSFVASETGSLTFNASCEKSFLQMVIFKKEKGGICSEIKSGIAEIQRLHLNTADQIVGLDYKIGGGVLYSLPMNAEDHIMIAFASEADKKHFMSLNWNFIAQGNANTEKIVDRRNDEFSPTLAFHVVDKETGHPVISNLSVEGLNSIEGLYIGSDFYFNLDRSLKLDIKCDAEGYFFHDSTYVLSDLKDNSIQIALERVTSGKSMTIESIEFVPGTSEITESSLPNLVRLRDFLALNSELQVEIQGHVFALGENSLAGQRISEARAKRVVNYLVDNGIDRTRLTSQGFGNTKPIYEKPKFYYEEQANRRVEVLIK